MTFFSQNCDFTALLYSRGLQTFSMEDHIDENLKTRGPKLTQSRWKLTVNNVGDRVLLPEI